MPPTTTTTTRTKIPINDEPSTQLSFNHPSHTHARQWLQQRIIMNMLNPFMTTTLNYCKHKFIQDQVVVTVVQFPHFSSISIPSPPTTSNLNLWFRRVSFTRLTGWLNARLLRLLFIQFLPVPLLCPRRRIIEGEHVVYVGLSSLLYGFVSGDVAEEWQ